MTNKYWKMMKVDKSFDKIVKDMQKSLSSGYNIPERKKSIFSTVIITKKIAEEMNKKKESGL